jgi:hypothetical protein
VLFYSHTEKAISYQLSVLVLLTLTSSKVRGAMTTAYLYENDTDQNQHSRAMQTLARELGMREEEDTETLRGNAWRVQSRGKDKNI